LSSAIFSLTKLEVSTAFLFRENRKHWTDGQTDGRGASLNAASMGQQMQQIRRLR